MYLEDIYGKPRVMVDPYFYHLEKFDGGFNIIYYRFQICDMFIEIGDIGDQYKDFFNEILDLIDGNKLTGTREFSVYDWDTGDISEFDMTVTRLQNIYYVEARMRYLEIFDREGEKNEKIYGLVDEDLFNDFLYKNHEPGYTVKFYTSAERLRKFVNGIFDKLDKLYKDPFIW
ncbi:hypothetical protein [Persephonella sp.]